MTTLPARTRALATLLDNGPDFVALDEAAAAEGVVHVPLPLFFTPAQRLHALQAAGVDTLVTPQGVERLPFAAVPLPAAAAATLDWNQPAAQLVALVNALQFGGYANPLALPKMNVNGRLLIPTSAQPGNPTTAVPGTILDLHDDSFTVATATDAIVLSGLQTLNGKNVSVPALAGETFFQIGSQLPILDAATSAALTALNDTLVRQEGYWLRRLSQMSAVELPYADYSRSAVGQNYAKAAMPLPAGVSGEAHALPAAFAVYLARLSGSTDFDIALSLNTLAAEVGEFASYFATQVPFQVTTDSRTTIADTLAALQASLDELQNKRKTFNRDIFLRQPELEALRPKLNGALLPVLVQSAPAAADFSPLAGTELALLLTPDQSSAIAFQPCPTIS